MTKRLHVGHKLAVTVKKLLPTGLLVRLPDGSNGIVRVREISWTQAEMRTWRSRFAPGDRLDAVFLYQRDRFRELSLRLLQDDPWQRVTEEYRVGQLRDGVVTGLESYGVFVELEPGVTGLLHKSELPPWAKGEIEELLWTGDHVKVLIKAVQPEERHIQLSMAALSSRRWQNQTHDRAGSEVFPQLDDAKTKGTRTQRILKGIAARGQHTIVVVEDDLSQLGAIELWLKQAGQQVYSAASGEEGWELITLYHPDIVLSDVGLSTEKSGAVMDGIAFVSRIQETNPQLTCALMTDWVRADERQDDLLCLQKRGVTLLLKPLLPDDLVELFAPVVSCIELDESAVTAPHTDPQPVPNSQTNLKNLEYLLQQALRTAGASKTILFQLDQDKRQVTILAHSGRDRLHEGALVNLIHSPVRDVAEDQQAVYIEHAEQSGPYLRHLTPLLRFGACWGLPVHCQTVHRYALFLFFPQPRQSTEAERGAIHATGLALGSIVERLTFLEHASEIQRVGLVGTLARGLAHEVNHHIGAINLALDNLRLTYQSIQASLANDLTHARNEMASATTMLNNLGTGIEKLARTARLFGRMTVQDTRAMLRVDRLVAQSVGLLQETIDGPVKVHFEQPEQILVTYAKATQVQQIVMNVLINAIQQIEQIRPQEGGTVHVSMHLVNSLGDSCIRIVVEDDGPGIHQRLRERVFELGFSTRENEGSGLGLYIARSLIQDMGGRIWVVESHALWGVTMGIELPILLGSQHTS